MALIQIVYVSTARADLGEADIEQIVETAARNNALRDLTGMLMYADGQFMQMLEGEETVIDALLDKLRLDPRHHDLTVLERAAIENRSFADWSMGFKRLDDGAPRATYVPRHDDNRPPTGLAGAILAELMAGRE